MLENVKGKKEYYEKAELFDRICITWNCLKTYRRQKMQKLSALHFRTLTLSNCICNETTFLYWSDFIHDMNVVVIKKV